MNIIEHVQKNKHFYGTVGSLNLGALCVGLAMSWPSPSFTHLYGGIGPPMLAYLDKAWVESTISVGAGFGGLASIFIADLYGRRISFSLSAGVLVAFWIFLVSSGADKILIISAAGVAGLGIGLFTATSVLYVAEISSPKNRSVVGAVVFLCSNFGIFAMYLCGYLFEVTILLCVMVTFPMAFLVTIYFWMIESPFFLFQNGTVLEAKISLKNLRDRRSVLEIDEEYKLMVAFFNSSIRKKPGQRLRESVCPKNLGSVAWLVIPALCVSQMLGIKAVGNFTEDTIESLYPATGKLATSFVDLVAIVLSIIVIEKFGRKPLLAIASFGAGFCCLLFAVYIAVTGEEQCRSRLYQVEDRMLPVSILGLLYAIYSLGCSPTLPIVTGEIFPCRAKTVAVGLSICLLNFVAFGMQQLYADLDKRTCLAFLGFTLLGAISLPLAMVLLPETKGKSLLQIQNELENLLVVDY